ncbi:MAG: helix-turn-helix transcriptional regulator [Acidimicrobiia bacterium]
MSERKGWESVKSARADTKTRRAGYAAAREAFELGARVRAERERLGLTQAELALRMGTNQPTVARLEAGGVTPSLDTLHRVAEALGMELVVDFRHAPSADASR